jgi:hypothetical protein
MSETPRPKKRLPLRWLSLAEFVGIVAVVIAALGYWDTHRERTLTERERAAEAQEKKAEARAGALKLSFLMTGAPEAGGERLRMTSVHPEQVIQTQSITFPTELRGDPVETTGNPRIDRSWLEDGLKKADRDRKATTAIGAGEERRVPVGIVTSYVEAGETKTDRSIYVVAYNLKSRLLRGATVKLEGISLLRRGVTGDLKAAVEAAWRR